MKPLSIFTYYRRHKKHAAILLFFSFLITAGLFSMIALVWAIFVEQPRQSYMILSEYSIVSVSAGHSEEESSILASLSSNPDIADVFPAKTIKILLPGLLQAEGNQFELHGLLEENVHETLRRLNSTIKEGRLPIPGTNGLAISEDAAAMLDLKVGESYEIVSSEFYLNVDIPSEPTSFEIVGILESEIEFGLVSLEFLNSHPLYRQFPKRFLVAAQEGREVDVDAYLRDEILDIHTSVQTLSILNERIINEALPGLVMLLPIVIAIAVAFSFVIVVVNRIANAGRLYEFGLLHAAGYSKRSLRRRLTLETAVLAFLGWLIGVGLASLFLSFLGAAILSPKGYDLDYRAWLPAAITFPLPAMIAAFTFVSIRRTFRQLDPVAIVERGQLSDENVSKDFISPAVSSVRPLGAATFFSRHRKRATWLVASMCLMILAVMFMILALAVGADAQKPLYGYLRKLSIIGGSGPGQILDENLLSSIKNHPAVDRAFPMAPRYHMLDIYIPPFTTAEASPFAVYAEDMDYLVELYDLELKEGSLPRPGTNEMVIPELLAKNRQIEVGTRIGDAAHPPYPGASLLPVEFIVSGIFKKPGEANEGDGLGFVSLEFLHDAEPYVLPENLPMMIIAKDDNKEELDNWLLKEATKANLPFATYQGAIAQVAQKAQQDMFSIAILEGIVALVAAIGLGVLNYIYIDQRQAEFGVLHALGYDRKQLILRVLRETAFITGAAWLLSMLLCLMGMLCLRLFLFTPRALSFDLIHIEPWLYSLPIPVLVLTITALVVARSLSKMDAVSIVEQRAA